MSAIYYYHYCTLLLSNIPSFFFFNDTATTEIYTLSLHDALPIYDSPGHVIRKRGSFGARTLRIRENVEIGERAAFDESKCRGVICFVLAGKTCDDIGADGGMREPLADKFYASSVMFGTIPAVHSREDAVGAGLQRHVEMLSEPLARSKQLHQILRNIHRLDGADAQAFDGGLIQNAPKQALELHARGEVAAVGAKIDSAQDDFAVVRLAELLKLANHGIRRQASALPANERNHAKRAPGIAAILNLERWTRVISFST